MKRLSYFYTGLLFIIACQQQSNSKESTEADNISEPRQTTIERIHPSLDQILSTEAELETLAEGFDWTEGPLWLEEHNMLIFSDIPPNAVFSWSEEQGLKDYLNPSGYTSEVVRAGEVGSNGLLLSPEGKLVLCQHGDRRLAEMNAPLGYPEPDYTTIVANFQGKRLNSPNDAAYSSNGDLYFTDPPYGLEKNMDDPLKELDFQGVYKLDVHNKLHLLTDEMTRPNGIALSVDENKLYVANSDPERAVWMEYNIKEDGMLDEGLVLYDATEQVGKSKGLPDGLKVHPSGIIFATGPGGVWILSVKGNHLGTIRTGQATSNCAFGNDYQYLYITADMYLMRIALL